MFTKNDLKNGDVVICRNGTVEIVCVETDTLITRDGFNCLSDIQYDLCDNLDLNWDIMKVRRPAKQSDCNFSAFEYHYGNLVFDRDSEINQGRETLETFIDRLKYEIINRPSPIKLPQDYSCSYLNGKVDRQNEILHIIDELEKDIQESKNENS